MALVSTYRPKGVAGTVAGLIFTGFYFVATAQGVRNSKRQSVILILVLLCGSQFFTRLAPFGRQAELCMQGRNATSLCRNTWMLSHQCRDDIGQIVLSSQLPHHLALRYESTSPSAEFSQQHSCNPWALVGGRPWAPCTPPDE